MIQRFWIQNFSLRQARSFRCGFFLLFLFFFLPFVGLAQYDASRYPIIPRPNALLPYNGEFQLNSETVLVTDNRLYRNEIDYFRKQVKQFYGIDLKYTSKRVSENFIYISEDSTDIPNEGYNLFIVRNEINLYGGHAGIFYGLQTLFQLIHLKDDSIHYDKDSNIVNIPGPRYREFIQYGIPSCSIVDQPRFSWRGMHLDVARHFYPKEDVKSYLRYMAMYKLNTFHWHLTDDQGWRIEIKKYPKLTSVGAWRNGTLIGHEGETVPRYDTIRYGGFYTQNDIKEIVRFADSLHITIVPEIEMPGHATALLAAYPEYGCTPGPFEVTRTWGVFEDVLCPTEKTFSFLDDILKEVCALFPGKYIHIGGDECPKARWKSSEFCQDLMKKNNLKTEDELQSWFTQRIVKMLQQKGKQAIGWDEILDGGLAEGAAVMSWRGEEGGIAAAKAKHNVVMSPGGYCYLDHYQSQNASEPLAIGGFLPIEKVYSYNPVPASLNEDEKKYILGLQGNLWTEYIPTFSQVQYMLFPRMCALAEVAWDEPVNMNYDFFVKRLMPHLAFMDRQKINYAKSIYDIHASVSSKGNQVQLTLSTFNPKATIRYSTTSYYKDRYSKIYTGPINIYDNVTVHAMVFPDTNSLIPISHDFEVQINLNKATGKPITLRKQPSPSYSTGGAATLVDGTIGRIPWVGSQWLGWSGDTLDATIDLLEVTSISEIDISTLFDPNSWIYQPGNFQIQFSKDGKTYTDLKLYLQSEEGIHGSDPRWHSFKPEGIEARYIRIIITGMTKIPSGSPGEGNPPWLFVDEIQVR